MYEHTVMKDRWVQFCDPFSPSRIPQSSSTFVPPYLSFDALNSFQYQYQIAFAFITPSPNPSKYQYRCEYTHSFPYQHQPSIHPRQTLERCSPPTPKDLPKNLTPLLPQQRLSHIPTLLLPLPLIPILNPTLHRPLLLLLPR